MVDIFISYSRKNKPFVQQFDKACRGRKLDIWVDWEDIRPIEDWWDAIRKGIEDANTFVSIITPDYIASEICNQELNYAVSLNKRIIPILLIKPERDMNLPSALSSRNWIYFDNPAETKNAFQTFLTAYRTDLEHVKTHTLILQRSLEWEANSRIAAYVLRGEGLTSAEQWLQNNAAKEPIPTERHIQYITASQRARVARRRVIGISLIFAMVIILVLVVLFFFSDQNRQRQEAQKFDAQNTAVVEANGRATAQIVASKESEKRATSQLEAQKQQKIAFVRKLLTQANSAPSLDTALLLGMEALRLNDTQETRTIFRNILEKNPRLTQVLHSPYTPTRLAISPDNRFLASEQVERVTNGSVTSQLPRGVTLWDISRGQVIAQLPDDTILGTFSPDSKFLTYVTQQGIVLWDIAARQAVGSPVEGRWPTTFGQNGQSILAVGRNDALIYEWRIVDRQPIGTPFSCLPEINKATILNSSFAVAVTSNKIFVCDLRTRNTRQLDTASTASLAINPDGSLLATGDDSSATGFGDVGRTDQADFLLVDATSGQAVRQFFSQHQNSINGIVQTEFSPDGKIIASSLKDGGLILWDVASGQRLVDNLYGTSPVFSPNGAVFASVSDNSILLWHTTALPKTPNADRFHRLKHEFSVTGFEVTTFRPDGKYIISVGMNGTYVTDVETGATQDIPAATEVRSAAFSPDSKLVAFGMAEGGTQIWDANSWTSLGEKSLSISEAQFSPDGKFLIGSNRNGTLSVLDTANWQPVWEALAGDQLVGFSADSKRFATIEKNNAITVFDIATRKPIAPNLAGKYPVAISLDGKLLAATNVDSNIAILWSIDAQKQLNQLPIDEEIIAFTPDNKLYTRNRNSSLIRLWDVSSAAPSIVDMLDYKPLDVFSISTSPDGNTLALITGTHVDQLSTTWLVNLSAQVQLACRVANRNLTSDEWQQYLPGEPYHETCPSRIRPSNDVLSMTTPVPSLPVAIVATSSPTLASTVAIQPTNTPVSSPALALTPTVVSCTGFAVTSRFAIGMYGFVLPGDPNLINSKPTRLSKDSTNTRVASMQSGSIFQVLDGPICSQEILWWKVNFNGVIGWTGEGTGSVYWIQPAMRE